MKGDIKINKNITKFEDTDVEKKTNKFHQHKSLILINNLDINKIVASNKVPFGTQDFKYFIDY